MVIADDLADVRLLARMTLEDSGYFTVVGEAADGREAIEIAGSLRPDVLLLDLSMPRLDGVEALPLICDASPDTKVVVVSSFSAARMEAQTRGRGAVGYIQKTLTQQHLVSQLLEVAGLLETIGEALRHAGLRLGADVRSASKARRFVDETLRQWDCADALDTVTLLVSELVTNAVIHAGTPVTVCLALFADRLRVEVRDGSPRLPAQRSYGVQATTGRGLQLVSVLASSWGVSIDEGGKTVWCEVEDPDLATGTAPRERCGGR